MVKKLIIANWKMAPATLASARELFTKTKRVAQNLNRITTVICPPFVFLGVFSKSARTQRCRLGAQDIFWKSDNARTGEISPEQLKSMGVSSVIVGHSERRALGEDDEVVNRKVLSCMRNRLRVILCIGESNRDSEGAYLRFIETQIEKSLAKVSRPMLSNLVIAYEPIWAVGSYAKRADTPDELFEMVIFIKKVLSDRFGKKHALGIPVLYGGSVNERNAASFLKHGGADGLLIGRASLDPKQFSNILKTVEHS